MPPMHSGQNFGCYRACLCYTLLARLWAECPSSTVLRFCSISREPAVDSRHACILSSGRSVVKLQVWGTFKDTKEIISFHSWNDIYSLASICVLIKELLPSRFGPCRSIIIIQSVAVFQGLGSYRCRLHHVMSVRPWLTQSLQTWISFYVKWPL